MIGYVMVGTKNLVSAVSFCDALMPRMRMTQVACNENYAAFAPQSALKKFKFYVTRPVDGKKLLVASDDGSTYLGEIISLPFYDQDKLKPKMANLERNKITDPEYASKEIGG